jgi:hypothetical protein
MTPFTARFTSASVNLAFGIIVAQMMKFLRLVAHFWRDAAAFVRITPIEILRLRPVRSKNASRVNEVPHHQIRRTCVLKEPLLPYAAIGGDREQIRRSGAKSSRYVALRYTWLSARLSSYGGADTGLRGAIDVDVARWSNWAPSRHCIAVQSPKTSSDRDWSPVRPP